jgi:hypothetical protein
MIDNNKHYKILQNETYLCQRFTKFVIKYSLMAKENLIVPMPEAIMQDVRTEEDDTTSIKEP